MQVRHRLTEKTGQILCKNKGVLLSDDMKDLTTDIQVI